MGEEIGCKHEYGVAGRVSDFQFVTLRDKFAAIPETRCRLECKHVCDCCHDKYEPAERVVYLVVVSHRNEFDCFIDLICKDKFDL